MKLEFSTVKAPEGKTKGAGSRIAGPAKAFSSVSVGEKGWLRVGAPQLVDPVRPSVEFLGGQADVFQVAGEPDELFIQIPSTFAASEVTVYRT